MSEDRNLEELAALFNEHQITDDRGSVTEEAEEATIENPAAQEEITSENEAPTAEKPAKSEATPSQEAVSEDEPELGVDDSGKRYVPEKRFKDVYGKAKKTERELEALKAQLQKGNALLEATSKPGKTLPEPERAIDKADVLELKLTKPQFNPQSSDYNQALDELAFKIFKADPELSIMGAAEKAEEYARAIVGQTQSARTEARQVKAIQADQGITSRVSARQDTGVLPADASDEQIEAWLKAQGQW